MDIKSLLKNKQILLTLGGVAVAGIVVAAVYLPGTLFKGALDVAYDPDLVAEPVSETVLTPTADVVNYIDDIVVPTTEEPATENLSLVGGETYIDNLTSIPDESPVAGLTMTTEDSTEDEGFLTTGIYTVDGTDEIAAETATYELTCSPVSYSDTGAFAAGEEMKWVASITPAVDQAITYAWTGEGLLSFEGETVTAKYPNPGTYRVSVTATPASQPIAGVAVPITQTLSGGCEVEIPAPVTELAPAATEEMEYGLSCDAVSLSADGGFWVNQEIDWVASISPPVDQTISYTWTGDGLKSTSGEKVSAVYSAPGTYTASVIAMPVSTFAANVAGPITEQMSARCQVEILSEGAAPVAVITDAAVAEDLSVADLTALPTAELASVLEEARIAVEEEATALEVESVEEEDATALEVEVVEEEDATALEVEVVEEEADALEVEVVEEEDATALEVEVVEEAATGTGANISQCGTPYPDDIAGHWAEAQIKKGYDYCLFTGIDGKFHPDWEIYRIEAAAMILYALKMEPDFGCFDNDCGTPFMDLTSPEEGGIIRPLWLKGLVEGYSRTLFKPHGFLTRAEAASMVVRAFFEPFNKPCPDAHCGAGWPDNFFYDIHDKWQGQYIRVLWDKGIMTGSGPNRVEPDNYITRAEMAKMIVAAYEMMQ